MVEVRGRERDWGWILYWSQMIMESGVGVRWSPSHLNRWVSPESSPSFPGYSSPELSGVGATKEPLEGLDLLWKADDLPVPHLLRTSAWEAWA